MKDLLAVVFLSAVSAWGQYSTQVHTYVNSRYAHAARLVSAADRGDAAARFDLGMLHEKGDVVPQNHKEALKWFKLSAQDGYAPAQLFLGLLYMSGRGVEKNNTEALKWIRKAADQGEPNAQSLLGGIYFSDSLQPHNYVEAYKWLRLASPANDAADSNTLESVMRRMTPEQISEAERLVAEWQAKTRSNKPADH